MATDQKSPNDKEVEKHLTDTAKQSGIVFIGKIAGYFFGFLANFILARFFSPEVVGQYSLVRTVVSLVMILTVFGLDKGLVKYIARYRSIGQTSKLNQVIKIAFIYAVISSIVGAILIFFLREIIAEKIFNDSSLVKSLVVGAWIVIPLTMIRLFGGLYRGFKQLSYFMIAKNIIRKLFFIISVILVSFLGFQETSLVIIMLLTSQILAVMYLIIKTKNLNLNLKKVLFHFSEESDKSKKARKELLTYSFTLIFIAFMGVILNKIDRIMLGIYMSSEVVGVYDISAKVAHLSTFLLMSSNMIFSSVISELYSAKKLDLLRKLYSTITKWIIILTLPIVATMVAFPQAILGFFGKQYIVGSSILIVLAVGKLIEIFPGANGYILSMSGNEKLTLINNTVMAILNIIINIILIPKFGMLGAALATAISISIVNIVKTIQAKTILDIIPYNKQYLHIFINLGAIVIMISVFVMYFNNFIGMLLVTIINFLLSIVISYQFKTQADTIVFEKVKTKLQSKL